MPINNSMTLYGKTAGMLVSLLLPIRQVTTHSHFYVGAIESQLENAEDSADARLRAMARSLVKPLDSSKR